MEDNLSLKPTLPEARQRLADIYWQLRGIDRMLKVEGTEVMKAAQTALIDLKAEMIPYDSSLCCIDLENRDENDVVLRKLQPLAFVKAKYKDEYEQVKAEYDRIWRKIVFYLTETKFEGIEKIAAEAGLTITKREFNNLISGKPLAKEKKYCKKTNMIARDAVIFCQAFGIAIPVMNDSFYFSRAKEGKIQESHHQWTNGICKSQPREWMKKADQKYKNIPEYISAVRIWKQGYNKVDDLKNEREERRRNETINNL